MSSYLVGTLRLGDSLGVNFLFQSSSLAIVADTSEVADENGNTVENQQYNHRAVVEMEAVIPRGENIPVPGQTVQIKGVTLPVVSASGVVSGNFKINADISTGSSVDFLVTGSPKITMQNKDVTKFNMQCARWLVNGIPASSGSVSN